MEIQYFNRVTNQVEIEKVYGEKAVRWLYESLIGRMVAPLFASRWFSNFYGSFQNMKFSTRKIPDFIEKFQIPMDEFLPDEEASPEQPYSSFNKFFIRRFKEGKRSFVQEKNVMPAFCEARYFGHESVSEDLEIPVKGRFLNAKYLLNDERWGNLFNKGPLLIARLCPVDYHRFHYPDNGKVIDYYSIPGDFQSVNPIALKKRPDIFIQNERKVTILETENFGKLAYIEVGATCVGRIVQTGSLSTFDRGDEKGYFLFGGSTVILLGEPGIWRPDSDILESTKNGVETYLQLGMRLGSKS